MSNNKQYSSVEWLYHKIVIKLCNDFQTIKYAHLFKEQLEQAKAMHKKEIEDSFDEGCYNSSVFTTTDAEQYYNETYGGNK